MQITQTDIIATLRAVVNKNTKLYKEDFKQDIKIFREAAKNPDTPEEKRTFLWLSRPMGTLCVPERDAFIKDTPNYIRWNYYREFDSSEGQSAIAYVVVVDGKVGNKISGAVYPIDYIKHSAHTTKAAIRTESKKVSYEKGDIILPSEKSAWFEDEELGAIKSIEYLPVNQEALKEVLRAEKERRTKQAKNTNVCI